MADDLSAPLRGKRDRRAPFMAFGGRSRLPLARIAFGVIALVIVGVVGRILFVNDPFGGQPSSDISINSTRFANAVADSVATQGPLATITAGPEINTDASGLAIITVDEGLPDGDPTKTADTTMTALYRDLVEETEHGAIPRMSATGRTPFEAYAAPSLTPATANGKFLIAIVVSGLGLNQAGTALAIDKLPDAVTLAFAPYGKGLAGNVGAARAAGHEILLEVPLEPFDYPESDPGPDTLLTGQAPRDNLNKLFTVMGKFGGYVGLVNHMGARFTASAADFSPVMEELAARGLGYLDDGSSNRSLAPQLAAANAVPFARADLALDGNPARTPILEALKALEDKATAEGSAVGVISALPVSITTLSEWTATLEERGFVIVPVSALMAKKS